MVLDLLEILHGSLTIVFVVISIILGIRIASRYPKLKRIEFLLFGIFWIGMTTPWWPNIITFIAVLFTGGSIPLTIYVVLGIAFLPITITIGLIAFLKVLPISKGKRNAFFAIDVCVNIAYEIYFFIFLFYDLSFIATYQEIFVLDWSIPSQIYFIFSLIVFLLVGIPFSRVSLRSDVPEIKMKGKFLLIAFISFSIGTVLDFAIPSQITYLIARLILLSSSLEFYIGLVLPRWTKRLLKME
ncbi:MAG: hypothetical protein ACFFA7_11805 [Promethearchaeota archaeon]